MTWALTAMRIAIVAAFGCLLAAAVATPAAQAAWQPDSWPLPPARYEVAKQRNVKIVLDDGRVLRANVHTPADASGRPLPGPFPVIVGFTPFGKTVAAEHDQTGINGLNLGLVRRGYIGAVVDVPGTGLSDGRFNLFDRDEAIAGRAVVEWAARLPRSTGNVGMIGLSYTAIVQLFTAAEVGPGSPLKAIFPMAAAVDPYRDLFVSGGALNAISPLGLLFGYGVTRTFTPFAEAYDDLPTALAYAAANASQMQRFEFVFARDMFANGERRYFGDFWAQRTPRAVLERIVRNDVPTFVIGGLYDVFQRGEPLLLSGLQNAAAGRDVAAPMDPSLRPDGRFQLLTGPWNHGNIGAGINLTALQLAWYDRWLKGVRNGIDETATPLHVLEPGRTRYDAEAYPLPDARIERLYPHAGGSLTAAPPTSPERPDSLIYTGIGDFCSRSTEEFTAGALVELMRAAGCWPTHRKPTSGPGEVTYTSEPLASPLQLAGPIGLTLYAGSTHQETFFAATVEDVGPDGRATDITGGDQLGTLRAIEPRSSWPDGAGGYVKPDHPYTRASRQMVPRGLGRRVRYDIEIRPAFATIPAGHRLRLRLATADFPHIVPLADFPRLIGGTYRVFHDPAGPTSISLSVR